MRLILAATLIAFTTATAQAQSLASINDGAIFDAAYTTDKGLEILDCACHLCGLSHGSSNTVTKPWTLYATQTADYGTNLTLPIGLTPANTLVEAVGVPPNILNLNQAAALGVLNILGFPGPPGPPPPTNGFFPDDFQFQTTAGMQYQRAVGDYGTFTASYNYYQNLHASVKQLDLQSHTPTLQYALKLTERLVATSYYTYAYYFLDGSSFVDQNRGGSYLTFTPNQRWDWILRGDYNHANFQPAPYLNSDNYAGTIEATRYLRGARNDYLRMGFGSGYSDAIYRGYSYQLTSVYMGSRKLFGANNQYELRLLGNYGIYNFFGTDALTGLVRDDRIFTGNIFVGRTFKKRLQVFASYTYLDSFSTVQRQLYDSSLTSLGVTYTR